MRIDSMKLAYEAFMLCRYFIPGAAASLSALERILPETLKQGVLIVDVDASYMEPLGFSEIEFLRAETGPSSAMSPRMQLSLSICLAAAKELRRLNNLGCGNAVRAIGLALHNFPSMIEARQLDNLDKFIVFVLSYSAPYWDQLETGFREALAEGAGLAMTDVEELVRSDRFACDLYSNDSMNDE